jgi:hypothetical protein
MARDAHEVSDGPTPRGWSGPGSARVVRQDCGRPSPFNTGSGATYDWPDDDKE